jgi:hypothetical protein
VVLIVGGIIVGPQVMHLAEPKSIELLSNVGLGSSFSSPAMSWSSHSSGSGPETRDRSLGRFRRHRRRSCGAACRHGIGTRAFVPVALGLTTTALGTLLPILRDNNMLRGSFGSYLLAGGAVGEFFPHRCDRNLSRVKRQVSRSDVAAGSRCDRSGAKSDPKTREGWAARPDIDRRTNATAQTTLRWTVVMLLLLLLIANTFGVDAVLGAFLAGVVLRRLAPGDVHSLEEN